jgi:hypothetical protein
MSFTGIRRDCPATASVTTCTAPGARPSMPSAAGPKPPAGIEIGASAAPAAILGREAIYQKTVRKWADFHIDV